MPPELTVRFLDLLAPLAFQTAASLKRIFTLSASFAILPVSDD